MRRTTLAAVCLILALADRAMAADLGNVMPLGDSITEGAYYADGYRMDLYDRLASDGFTLNYIGNQTLNASPAAIAAGQQHHEGISGFDVQDLSYAYHSAIQGGVAVPDVVLLHAATNDLYLHTDGSNDPSHPPQPEDQFMAGVESRYMSFLNVIEATGAREIFVAGIIPMNLGTNPNGVDYNVEVRELNAWLRTTAVPSFGNTIFVDQYTPFCHADGTPNFGLLQDGLHPNLAGFEVMAQTWDTAIEQTPEPGCACAMAIAAVALCRRPRRINGRAG